MDGVIFGGTVATMTEDGRYGLVQKGAVAFQNGAITFAGKAADLPVDAPGPHHDFGDRLVTPGLVDCHTHIVHGGNRAGEFEMRLEGASYEQVQKAGGGILSTMRATREASEETLLTSALKRVDHLLAEGVTTLEIKSGYGLTIDDELKMLRVARRIEDARPVRVLTAYLAAHALPPEYTDNDRYIDEVVLPGLDRAAEEGLVDAVDGFCESFAFTAAQMDRIFAHADRLSLPVKLHAEQLSHAGGTKVAADHKAISADHLEYVTEEDAEALAAAGTVAVLLPGACYTLRQDQKPDVAALRAAGVKMAVATDCNPGSSPLTSLLLTMNMAATLFRLTPEEALAGATREGARALGLTDTGTLEAGKRADIAVWDITAPAELSYRIGFNPHHATFFGGVRR